MSTGNNSTSPRLCIPHGTGPEYLTESCNTSSVLAELAIFNALALAISIVTGHDNFRTRIPRYGSYVINTFSGIFKSSSVTNAQTRSSAYVAHEEWRPWSGLAMCVIQVILAAVSTLISRSTGYKSSFSGIMALWLLRPRVSFMMFLFGFWELLHLCWNVGIIDADERYRDQKDRYWMTLLDMVIFEALMSIITIPFALELKRGLPAVACTHTYLQSMGVSAVTYSLLASSLNFSIFVGVLSIFIIAGWCLWILSADGTFQYQWCKWSTISWFIFAIGTFTSNWVFWNSFIVLSRGGYCPAGIISTGVAWGVGFMVNGILRPLFQPN